MQAGYLLGCAGASRFAYNFAVDQIRGAQDKYERMRACGTRKGDLPRGLTAIDLQARWYASRDESAPWHGEYSSRLYLFAFRAARAAYVSWMAGRGGFPSFRSRRSTLPSFQVCESIALEPGRLKLPRIGWIHIAAADGRQADLRRLIRRARARVTSVRVHQDAAGTWWASLQVERTTTWEPHERPAGPREVVGVDLGLKTLAIAATAGGTVVLDTGCTGTSGDERARARRAQRAVSRKDRVHTKAVGSSKPVKSPSRRRAKAQQRLARAHRRQRWQREDRLHKLSRALADRGGVVVVEDLATKAMTAKGGARKKGLNRRVAEAGFAELRRQLAYKLPAGDLLVADRWYPSSRLCSVCGVKNHDLTLRDRAWTCICGARHDRDINAATNLAAWGEHHLHQQAGGTRAGDRQCAGSSADTGRHARNGEHHTQHHRVPAQPPVAASARTRHHPTRGGQDLEVPGQGTVAARDQVSSTAFPR